MKTAAIVTAFIGLLAALLCWDYEVGRPEPPTGTSEKIPVSYGGIVYYFESPTAFGVELSSFIKSHPDLRVVSVAPLDSLGHGSTRGYWVVVEKREITK